MVNFDKFVWQPFPVWLFKKQLMAVSPWTRHFLSILISWLRWVVISENSLPSIKTIYLAIFAQLLILVSSKIKHLTTINNCMCNYKCAKVKQHASVEFQVYSWQFDFIVSGRTNESYRNSKWCKWAAKSSHGKVISRHF